MSFNILAENVFKCAREKFVLRIRLVQLKLFRIAENRAAEWRNFKFREAIFFK